MNLRRSWQLREWRFTALQAAMCASRACINALYERADATDGPQGSNNVLQRTLALPTLIRAAPGRADGRSAVAGLRGGELAGMERLRSFLSGAAGPGSEAGAPAGAHATPSAAHANGLAQGAAQGTSSAPSAAPIQVRLASQACNRVCMSGYRV